MMHKPEYYEYVCEDLKRNEGLTRPVKAGLFERVFVDKAPTAKLHPNPEDEFCKPEIGPNYTIVQDYMRKLRILQKSKCKELDDFKIGRLIVEKIKPDGYMILNGHHRWFAARMVQMPTVKIRIVNVTQVEDVLQAMKRTSNPICVSLDLDEVVMVPEGGKSRKIREGVPALTDALHHMGCDIWVYTGSYASEAHIRRLLGRRRIHVDGIVNGMKNRGSEGGFTEHFKERYAVSVHIDTGSVTCVDTRNKTYEIIDLQKGPDVWASEAVGAIRGLDMVKKALG